MSFARLLIAFIIFFVALEDINFRRPFGAESVSSTIANLPTTDELITTTVTPLTIATSSTSIPTTTPWTTTTTTPSTTTTTTPSTTTTTTPSTEESSSISIPTTTTTTQSIAASNSTSIPTTTSSTVASNSSSALDNMASGTFYSPWAIFLAAGIALGLCHVT